MHNRLELPPQAARVELRSAGDEQQIVGYGAVFYDEQRAEETQYRIGPYLERIGRNAFDGYTKADVRALVNHDANWLLGRSTAKTLRLSVDEVGLQYEITVNRQDPDHLRAIEKIARGDLSGSSFAFDILKDGIEESPEGTFVRTIKSVRLYDVGPVTFPAYTGTATALRAADEDAAIADIKARLAELAEAQKQQVELQLGHYARLARFRLRQA